MCAPHDVLSNAGDLPRDGCGGAARPIDAERERDELGAVRARKGHKVVRDYAALDKPAAPLRRPPVEIAPRPQIGRAHVRTPVNNAALVCRLLDAYTNLEIHPHGVNDDVL